MVYSYNDCTSISSGKKGSFRVKVVSLVNMSKKLAKHICMINSNSGDKLMKYF